MIHNSSVAINGNISRSLDPSPYGIRLDENANKNIVPKHNTNQISIEQLESNEKMPSRLTIQKHE